MGRQPGLDAEYVTARAPWLRGVAYLLCGDWHRARLAWNLDGYARKTLVNTFLAEQRTPWWRSVVLRGTDERAAAGELDLDAALDLRRALAALPPRQRVTVVLRYYCDLSVEDVAKAMECSPGNVKSQTARGIEGLRGLLDLVAEPEDA